uniref:Uncharacterized protein n=1 Tax=Anguilla anguilla TaxID=7936 RepID=A0A0E9VSK2_ANGAN
MPINDRYSWDFCLNVLQSESTFAGSFSLLRDFRILIVLQTLVQRPPLLLPGNVHSYS